MPDSGKVGSNLQSFPRSRGPFDGKLFVKHPKVGGASFNEGDIWMYLRMVTAFEFRKNEQAPTMRYESRKGKQVPIEGFYRRREPSIAFTLGEAFDPYAQQFGFGDDNTPTTAEAANAEQLLFALTMNGAKKYDLPVEFNLVSAVVNNAKTVTGTPFNGSGSLAEETYYYLIVPVFNGVESGYRAAAESAGVVVATPNDTVQVDWALDTALGGEPDFWKIYRNATAAGLVNYGASSLLATVAGTNRSYIDTAAAPGAGQPSSEAVTFVVTDETEATTYVADTDYTVDIAEGTLARVEGGAIADGQLVVITLTWRPEAKVVIPLDEGRFNSYTMPVMFLGQQSGSRSPTAYTGFVRITLGKVDFSKGADMLNPLAEGDAAGLAFDLPVLFEETNARFGTLEVFDEAVDGFTVVALT